MSRLTILQFDHAYIVRPFSSDLRLGHVCFAASHGCHARIENRVDICQAHLEAARGRPLKVRTSKFQIHSSRRNRESM